jgi:hypothetical protein
MSMNGVPDDERDDERGGPEAAQAIMDLLRPIRVEQVIAYLEKTGWLLWANRYTRLDGWTLHPDDHHPRKRLYIKSDPESDGDHFVVEVPGREELRDHLHRLQFAVERLATVEETTFVTMICRLRDVEQLVLLPEKKEE